MDGQQYGTLPIDTDNVGLWRKAIADPGDILNVDGRVPDGLDRYTVQLIHRLRRRIGNINVVFLAADFRGAGWQN